MVIQNQSVDRDQHRGVNVRRQEGSPIGVVKIVHGRAEGAGILGDLTSRLQEGFRATLEALGQSHAQRLAAIVESTEDAILSVNLDGLVATWNGGAQTLFGYTAEQVVGKAVTMLIPSDREGEEVALLARIRDGERIDHYKTERRRKDGRIVEVSLTLSPIKDGRGTIIGASKIVRDISEHEQARKLVARRVQEQAALFEFTDRLFRAQSAPEIYDAALDAIGHALGCERASILLFDDAGVMKFVCWRGLSEQYRRAVEGHSPWTRDSKDPEPLTVDDIDAAELEAGLKATVKAEGIAALAFIPLTAQGRLAGKFMTYYDAAHAFNAEEIALAVTIARQLGFAIERLQAEEERRRAEDAKELLVGESRHRIKNVLATVQALAAQTLGQISAKQRESFLARLHALGEAHDLLTTENWDWAELGEVVERALKPFKTDQLARIVTDGPSLWISANNSLLLTMCLNELVTNAAKYGALPNSTGQVHVAWRDALGSMVQISWRETGGPPVIAPAHKGFGSRLIEASFSGVGRTEIEFGSDGLRCLFKFNPG